MEKTKNGFREIEHTADLELKVWGQDLSALFTQAAQGLYHLSQLEFIKEPENLHPQRLIQLKGIDREDLLVAFLDELLYMLEDEHLAFNYLELKINPNHTLKGWGHGIRVLSQTGAIKAATYHNLKIRPTKDGFETNIVFDV